MDFNYFLEDGILQIITNKIDNGLLIHLFTLCNLSSFDR